MSALNSVIGFNRRAHLRVPLAARARLSADGRAASVPVRDLSLGGLGTDETPGFEPGTTVEIELHLDGDRIRAPGEIVLRPDGLGVRFTRLDQRALTQILLAVSRPRA